VEEAEDADEESSSGTCSGKSLGTFSSSSCSCNSLSGIANCEGNPASLTRAKSRWNWLILEVMIGTWIGVNGVVIYVLVLETPIECDDRWADRERGSMINESNICH
jgi:hypothetical protein